MVARLDIGIQLEGHVYVSGERYDSLWDVQKKLHAWAVSKTPSKL